MYHVCVNAEWICGAWGVQRRRRSIWASWPAVRSAWGLASRSVSTCLWLARLRRSSPGSRRTRHFRLPTALVSDIYRSYFALLQLLLHIKSTSLFHSERKTYLLRIHCPPPALLLFVELISWLITEFLCLSVFISQFYFFLFDFTGYVRYTELASSLVNFLECVIHFQFDLILTNTQLHKWARCVPLDFKHFCDLQRHRFLSDADEIIALSTKSKLGLITIPLYINIPMLTFFPYMHY